MKLELDFTNKVIVVVGKGSVKEFIEIINTPDFEDWNIDIIQAITYIPQYPYYPINPPYEITCSTNCGCTDVTNKDE